jgi:formamidase
VSGVVDIPNACVSLYIPTEIFEFDIRPNAQGPTRMVTGGDLARASGSSHPREDTFQPGETAPH